MSTIADFYRDRYATDAPEGCGPEDQATFRPRVEAVLRALAGQRRRVLDFGCNAGAFTRHLADAGHDVVGVDISLSAVQVARARIPQASFEVVASEREVPFPEASFDACVSTETIEHLFDVPGFIREIHRVLKPGGQFLITTPYHGWLKNLVVISGHFDTHFDPTSGHIRFFSNASLRRCLTEGGFEVERMSGIGRFWPLWKSVFVVARKPA